MLLTQESENEAFMSVWNRITPELLTPRIFLEKSWRLNGGTINHYCYLARPFPKYRLKALYNCFKDHLEQNDIPIDQKTLVGGRLHRYEPKPVLELRRFKVNPAILAGRVRDVYGYRLT